MKYKRSAGVEFGLLIMLNMQNQWEQKVCALQLKKELEAAIKEGYKTEGPVN